MVKPQNRKELSNVQRKTQTSSNQNDQQGNLYGAIRAESAIAREMERQGIKATHDERTGMVYMSADPNRFLAKAGGAPW